MANKFETPTFPIKGLTASYAVSASWTEFAVSASCVQGSDGQAVITRTEFNNLKNSFERVSGSFESYSGSWKDTSEANAGSPSIPVYISGGMPYTVSRINGIPVTASVKGNLTGTASYASDSAKLEGKAANQYASASHAHSNYATTTSVSNAISGAFTSFNNSGSAVELVIGGISKSLFIHYAASAGSSTTAGSAGTALSATSASQAENSNKLGGKAASQYASASHTHNYVTAAQSTASIKEFVSGAFTDFSASGSATQITVGGTTKKLTVPYATSAGTATKLVNKTSGSTSVPVYISGGVPQAVTSINLAAITASSGFRGNIVGDVTGSRVSASVQVYAPNVTATNVVTTNLTASYIKGNLVGTASNATSASYVPFTQFVQTKNVLTASIGGTTRTAVINSASYAVNAATAAFTKGTASYAIEASKVTHTLKLTGSVNATYNGASDVTVSIPDPLDIISGSTSSIAATASWAFYAKEAGNADTLDGTHKTGLFTQYIVSGANTTRGESNNFHIITVGDTLKSASLKHAHNVTVSSAGTKLTVNVAGVSSSVTPTYASVAGYATSSLSASYAQDSAKVGGKAASQYASASHTHDYLPLTGGTLNLGSITALKVNKTVNEIPVICYTSGSTYYGYIGFSGSKPVVALVSNPTASSVASYNEILHNGNYASKVNTIVSGAFTGFSASGSATQLTIGGVTKKLTVPYATSAGSATSASQAENSNKLGGKAASQYASASHTHNYTTTANVNTIVSGAFTSLVQTGLYLTASIGGTTKTTQIISASRATNANTAASATSASQAENSNKLDGVVAATYGTRLTGSQAVFGLSNGVAIPSGSDLNSYKVVGNYYQGATATAKFIVNGPVATSSMQAFTLKVENSTGTGYPRQILRFYNKGRNETWTRYSTTTTGSGTWTDWSVSTDAVTLDGKAASQYASSSHTHTSVPTASYIAYSAHYSPSSSGASSQGSTAARTYLKTVSTDGKGHVVGFTTGSETVVNTDTKVTSVSNHYTPVGSTTKYSPAGGAITTIAMDAAGHITSITSSMIKASNMQILDFPSSTDKSGLVWEKYNSTLTASVLYKAEDKLYYYPASGTLVNTGEVRAARFTHNRVTGSKSGTVTLAAGNTTYIDTPTGNITLATGSVASGQEGIYHCIVNMGTLYSIVVPGTLAEGSALIDKPNCKYEISICEGIAIIIRT